MSVLSNRARSAILNILIAGIITGVLDAVAAIVIYKADPERMFRYIASAATGPVAFTGSVIFEFLGVIFHFVIAIVWAALLSSVYVLMRTVLKHWLAIGIVWGMVVWAGMNLLVLPLSHLTRPLFDIRAALIAITILIMAVGIPASFIISRRHR